MIVVRKEGATGSHCDFHMRRSVVLHAMKQLIEHINHDFPALLPDDEDPCQMRTMLQQHKMLTLTSHIQ